MTPRANALCTPCVAKLRGSRHSLLTLSEAHHTHEERSKVKDVRPREGLHLTNARTHRSRKTSRSLARNRPSRRDSCKAQASHAPPPPGAKCVTAYRSWILDTVTASLWPRVAPNHLVAIIYEMNCQRRGTVLLSTVVYTVYSGSSLRGRAIRYSYKRRKREECQMSDQLCTVDRKTQLAVTQITDYTTVLILHISQKSRHSAQTALAVSHSQKPVQPGSFGFSLQAPLHH